MFNINNKVTSVKDVYVSVIDFRQVTVCQVILRNTEQKNFVFKPIFQSAYVDPVFSSLDLFMNVLLIVLDFQSLSFPNLCVF